MLFRFWNSLWKVIWKESDIISRFSLLFAVQVTLFHEPRRKWWENTQFMEININKFRKFLDPSIGSIFFVILSIFKSKIKINYR